LTNLVENLLSLSRLQAGALSVQLVAVAVDGAVAQAVLNTGSLPVQVQIDVPDNLPPVRADAGLLERVIGNLLTNAAAASPPGHAVRVIADSRPGEIQLRVIDHGPGVPIDQQARIFEPFQRLHDRSTTAGLGLGLAIARGFMEAMNGRIAASDTPGGGLTMTISLPTAQLRSSGPARTAAGEPA